MYVEYRNWNVLPKEIRKIKKTENAIVLSLEKESHRLIVNSTIKITSNSKLMTINDQNKNLIDPWSQSQKIFNRLLQLMTKTVI